MLYSYSEIENLRTQMISDRSSFMSMWYACSKMFAPRRMRDGNTRNDGRSGRDRIITNVGGLALRVFHSGMMNGSTPQARSWHRLTSLDYRKAQLDPVKRYFSEIEATVNNRFQASNLYRVLPATYKDVGVFSNGCFLMLPEPRLGFYFYPVAMGTYTIARDHQGRPNTFSRDFTMSVRQIVERYGKLTPTGHIDWSNMDSWVQSAWKNARYQDTGMVTNVIVPNRMPSARPFYSHENVYQSYSYLVAGVGGIPNQSNRGFRTEDIVEATDKVFMDVKGYSYFPVIASGWELLPEDDWGVDGPAELALDGCLTVQQMERDRLEAVGKGIRPPMIGPTELRRHQASILAGGITYVDESSEGKKFRPAFEIDPKLADLIANQQDYKDEINEAFFKDLFLMLASERPVGHVSAREIEERASEKLAAISPALGQMDDDIKGPLIENAFHILTAQGKLPKPPKELDGELIRPEYTSILAQAAKAAQMTSLERGLSFAVSVSQAYGDPTILQRIDPQTAVRSAWDYLGADPNSLRSDEEFAKIQQAAQMRQAQARQQAQLAQSAETAKNLSQAKVGEGSLIDEMI